MQQDFFHVISPNKQTKLFLSYIEHFKRSVTTTPPQFYIAK